ncbi:NitT/TauT family transport system permease protein [Ancylobacter aquaticus]|uniref:NitT/TauT family transport system permease protein n=1 Tax=Ancylobacter aquaticus TaxID=100 RepID=A0A4V2PK53_ANCAQ|nr:ABC transporter permease subunit [Ancylobacter aquaticus]TCK31146.1 NitT/TauT family transport system permease protein [Ancylobacter aquaticus]
MTMFGYRVPMMASLLVWCFIWELVGRSGAMFLVPPLSDVLVAAVALVQTGTWQAAAITTLNSFLVGMFFAITVGIAVGVLMGRSTTADNLLGIWVNIFVSAPLSALVPVLMILFGMGETTVVVTVFLFAVWIIVLDTRAGIQGVPPSLVEMGRSYGASPWTLYGKIIFLAALPEILAGIRLGVVRGVKGVVIGQLLVAIIGYGELFELYSRNFDMVNFWALTIILFAAAMGLSALIENIEKRVDYYAGVR